MQTVPFNRLLNQPTVQLKWLEQHRSIEFVVPAELRQRFMHLWPQVEATRLALFVQQDQAQSYRLYDDDPLFALLAGADYITTRHASFQVAEARQRLIWSI